MNDKMKRLIKDKVHHLKQYIALDPNSKVLCI